LAAITIIKIVLLALDLAARLVYLAPLAQIIFA
jgi:hypothetical protein